MSENKEISEADMSVGEHLNELRTRIVRSVIVLLVLAVVAFIYKGIILDVIFAPMQPDFITNRFFDWLSGVTGVDAIRINSGEVNIVNTKMAGQFNLHIKSSIMGALVVAIPYLLWQFWLFIKPALTIEIQRKTRFFVFQTSVWFFIGLSFGYFAIAPLAVNFLTGYDVSSMITNMIDVSSYLSTVIGVSFAAAIIFQLPLLVTLLSTIGILKAALMRRYRKVAFAIIIVVAAIITPPDVFSQVLIAIPLYGLYEYGITIADRIEKRKALQEIENKD